MVCHRRAGKTVAGINDLIKRNLLNPRERPQSAYIAPLFKQAKAAVWDYLKHYTAGIPGATAHESELRVDLPHGGRVRLYGADNPDALRGIYLDDVLLDEYAQMRPSLWTQIIRPALADRLGSATFIGTPKGRNEFYTIAEEARKNPEWFFMLLKASESGLLDPDELISAAKQMSPDEYAQEFECSFDAAIKGSYFGELMNIAQTEGRILPIALEPALRVGTAWDLGIGDSTAIWFFQQVANEIRFIDYLEASGVGLSYYVGKIDERRAKGWIFGEHILPHDVSVKELGTGKSRLDVLRDLGLDARVLPNLPLDDGINAARMLLPKCYFDSVRCADGIEHLRQYRREFDEKLKSFKHRPLHDEHSHAADAFRYAAVGVDDQNLLAGAVNRDRYRHDRSKNTGRSWMSA